jgi:hypothetical protein
MTNKILKQSWLGYLAAILFGSIPGLASADRPPLYSEKLYLSTVKSSTQYSAEQRSWVKQAQDLGVPGMKGANNGYDRCVYPTALEVVQEIVTNDGNRQYANLWATNQGRVFAACEGTRKEQQEIPVAPAGKRVPARARGDYLYQMGSWHFYRNEFEQALGFYRSVAAMKTTPMRPRAAYMVARTLAEMNNLDAAYAMTETILADRKLHDVHDITTNYRFVMMHPTHAISSTGRATISPLLAKRHLAWLLNLLSVSSDKPARHERARSEFEDAMSQLSFYFPALGSANNVDWWLDPPKDLSPRMSAVAEFAPKIEMIDWMQARVAYNVFDVDWLWALHAQNHIYWTQNQNLVVHEMEQWQRTGNGAWLELAIRRVHHADPMATVLSRLVRPYIQDKAETETIEYRQWRFVLWQHALRIALGQGQLREAINLVSHHREMATVLDYRAADYQSIRAASLDYYSTINAALRWLTYTGDIAGARELLALFSGNLATDWLYLSNWKALLAIDEQSFLTVGQAQFRFTSGVYRPFWREMLNLVSGATLEKLVREDNIPQEERTMMAATLLVRSILLNKPNAEIDRLAAIAAKHNPLLREDILSSTATHERIRYFSLLLRHPRFRPTPLLEYAPSLGSGGSAKTDFTDAIDVYNHNDNNWWCRLNEDSYENRVRRLVEISPAASQLLAVTDSHDELSPYLANQSALLANHPYRQLIDRAELDALKNIPSAPEYLGTSINEFEQNQDTATTPEEKNRRAANLHRVVRTTRYGCNRDGSHTVYSRDAFQLLHKRYSDTPWATATPHWFR